MRASASAHSQREARETNHQDLPRSDLRADFASPSNDGLVRDLRLQPGQMLSQHRHLRILLRDPPSPSAGMSRSRFASV